MENRQKESLLKICYCHHTTLPPVLAFPQSRQMCPSANQPKKIPIVYNIQIYPANPGAGPRGCAGHIIADSAVCSCLLAGGILMISITSSLLSSVLSQLSPHHCHHCQHLNYPTASMHLSSVLANILSPLISNTVV